MFPVHPGGIAYHVVELAHGEWGEVVLEEPRPQAVQALAMEFKKLLVKRLQGTGRGLPLSRREAQLLHHALHEIVGGYLRAHGFLKQGAKPVEPPLREHGLRHAEDTHRGAHLIKTARLQVLP